MAYASTNLDPSSFTRVVNTSTLTWNWGWGDWDTGGHDWNINWPSNVPAGWGLISDSARRDGGHPLPCCENFMLVNTNAPVFAKPCTGYQLAFTFPTGGGMKGRRLWKPIHSDPQYIGIGVCIDRASIDAVGAGGQPAIGAYYCINRAFLQNVGTQVLPLCADGNCDKNQLRLYKAVETNNGNITLYNTYRILSYDEVLAGCKGLRGVSSLKDISSSDCSWLLSALYTADDIKTGKVDFCATNPGWCDKTEIKFCTDYPNHSACDCLNTTSRALWAQVDALLVPAAKGAPLACKSPFCNARNDVFKTSQMIVDGRNCPDIRYIDQSVRVDGQGNITKVTQEGNIGGDTTTTSTSTSNTTNTANTGDTIVGMNPTLFYILLFLFIVVIIVVSLKYSDGPERLPPAQTSPELTA